MKVAFFPFPVFKRVKETGKEVAQNLCSFVSILFFFSLFCFRSDCFLTVVMMEYLCNWLLYYYYYYFIYFQSQRESSLLSFLLFPLFFFFTRQGKHNFVLSFFSSPFDENECRKGEKRKVKLERRCFFRSCSWWIIGAARCSISTMTMAAMVWK